MATKDEHRASACPTGKEEQLPSQEAGLIRRSDGGDIERRHRSTPLGLPPTAYKMFRMVPISLSSGRTDEFDRAPPSSLPIYEESGNIAWIPTVEISENDGECHILAEFTGLSPNEVQMEVKGDALILTGERPVEQEFTDRGVHRNEQRLGLFYRRIPLPEGSDAGRATARFHDGLLEVIMPASPRHVKQQPIRIEADSESFSDEAEEAS